MGNHKKAFKYPDRGSTGDAYVEGPEDLVRKLILGRTGLAIRLMRGYTSTYYIPVTPNQHAIKSESLRASLLACQGAGFQKYGLGV